MTNIYNCRNRLQYKMLYIIISLWLDQMIMKVKTGNHIYITVRLVEKDHVLCRQLLFASPRIHSKDKRQGELWTGPCLCV